LAQGNQILTQLLFNIEANTASLKSGLDRAQNQISSFGNNVTKLGGLIGVAFGAKEILSFGLEVSKLAGEFAGVENAFKKLEGSAKLMDDLKKATSGTVSELNLMKRAVQFSNFGLSLEQLPKLLEFSTKRAQQTGQSVDYLVDSIVTGLGRKSVLILDNLGISSSQLNAEIAKTGDFMSSVGNIVDKELTKMGDAVETNLTKTERLSASWENFKVRLGEAANSSGILGSSLDALSGTLDLLASRNLSVWEKLASLFGGVGGVVNGIVKDAIANSQQLTEEQKKHDQVIREVDRAYVEFKGNIEAYSKAISTHVLKTQLLEEFTKRLNAVEQKRQGSIENITNLTARLNDLTEQQKNLTGQQLANTNREILAIEEKIKALKELGTVQEKVKLSFDPKSLKVASTAPTSIDAKGLISNVKPLEMSNQVYMLADAWDKVGESINQSMGETAVTAIDAVGESLTNLSSTQQGAFKSLVGSMLGGIRQIINALLAQTIASAIAGEASKGLVGLITGAIAVGALTALFKSKVPSFATGGNYAGGLALVGEMGPELIDFNKSGRVYNHKQTKDIFYGNRGLKLEAIVTGEQLRFILSETERRRG
jgi:hypothetical protein